MKHYAITTWLSSLSLLFFISCSAPRELSDSSADTVIMKKVLMDTMVVTAEQIDVEPDVPYRASYTRVWDLLKTTLDLEVLWEEKSVKGHATLLLEPLFYDSDQIVLDAKDMEFSQVKTDNQTLEYSYDGDQITIQLPKRYAAGDKCLLHLSYQAFPYRDSIVPFGSRGMYFIGDSDDDFGQIWTQGETEYNSQWFPTIDKPNERCTQEVKVTVPAGIECLSNGQLVSHKVMDTKSQYHYKLDIPHAPYLFMLAAGEFYIEEDRWQSIPLQYWVDSSHAAFAKKIFNHTPEMLSFFSETFDYPYPWPKYDQAVVKEYVSGAMENTSAVLFGEFVQKVAGELIDAPNDDIVAHEMAHHWFGDLTTCESWSNLTMNEGFANYSEYLWREYKYGKEQAEYHRMNELRGYLREYNSGRIHDLIDFYYEDAEDMFDAHSYNKGGLILHMLRNEVGDKAFFESLNLFLTDNALESVEAHDLRLALEEVTGRDFNWFFNQWFFDSGHPILDFSHSYTDGQLTVNVSQRQVSPVFQLPLTLFIKTQDATIPVKLFVDEREFSQTIPLAGAPILVVPDPHSVLLAEWSYSQTAQDHLTIISEELPYKKRYLAYQNLMSDTTVGVNQWLFTALQDSHWSIRSLALNHATENTILFSDPIVLDLMKNDPSPTVRSAAIDYLCLLGNKEELSSHLTDQIERDSSYNVLFSALNCLAMIDLEKANAYKEKYMTLPGQRLKLAVANVIARDPSPEDTEFMQSLFKKLDGENIRDFAGPWSEFIKNSGPDQQKDMIDLVTTTAKTDASPWRRFGSTLSLIRLIQSAEQPSTDLQQKLKDIIASEQNTQLVNIYKSYGVH